MILAEKIVQPVDEVAAMKAEIIRLRRELKSSKRLIEQKNLDIQTHNATLSHEIRTPLISIRGFASILQNDLRDSVSEEYLHYIDRICKNVDRIESLINDILLLSRLQFDEKKFQPVDMQRLCTDILSEMQGEFRSSAPAIHIQPDLPFAHGYEDGLRHVIANLITNAIKYCRPGVDPELTIGCERDELFLKYFVADNGLGIPASARKKIFEPYHRLGQKPEVTGHGLGLTICRRIIMAHGGEIWVQSRRGKGSTFYFTLPKAKTAQR